MGARLAAVLLVVSSLVACDDAVDADDGPPADADVEAPDVTDVRDADADEPGPDPGPSVAYAEPIDQLAEFEPPGDFSLPPAFVPEGDEFLVAVIPDTQAYADRYPETFEQQMKWLADHAEEYRIEFVTHVGDIVQTSDHPEEWEAAQAAYAWLDDVGVPHGFAVGSHDFWVGPGYDGSCSTFGYVDCDGTHFRENFGPQRYADRAWYGGASPSELSSFQRVDVDGMELLFLHLLHDTPAAEITWAETVLDAHPGALVHLTTHRYLFDYRLTDLLPEPLDQIPSGRFNPIVYTLGGQGLVFDTGLTADQLFQDFIATHPNIWAVHCGHVDAEFRQSTANDAGLPVHEVLVDYQNLSDGGGGWLRLLKYRPSADKVDVLTFSTKTGAVRADGDGFDHAIDILDDYRNQAEDALALYGLTPEDLQGLLDEVRTDGELRDAYYESLYGGGQRDSIFELDVDFDAYMAASR